MKINLQLFMILILSGLVHCNVMSQSKIQRQPLPLAVYNDNVNAPLTAKELMQIKEVYGEEAENLVLSKPQRLKDIKNILRNRVLYKEVGVGEVLKGYPMLSEVPLFDYYVSSLEKDAVFNPLTFNPLKYNFNFYSRIGDYYKVDNSNYYIIIKSQHQ